LCSGQKLTQVAQVSGVPQITPRLYYASGSVTEKHHPIGEAYFEVRTGLAAALFGLLAALGGSAATLPALLGEAARVVGRRRLPVR